MERAISLLGLAVLVFLAWLMSFHRRTFPWRMLVGGLLLQFVLALLVLRTTPGQYLFDFVGELFVKLLSFVDSGSRFMFEVLPRDGDAEPQPQGYVLLRTFAFSVLPTVVFFSSLMSVLYYVGVMQWLVRGMAWLMQRTLRTSGAESLAAAANVFVGHTEAPLVIRPYLPTLTLSELNAVMVGGFATISSGLLAVYVGQGISAGHLITASVISAPAALLVAKIIQPELESPATLTAADVKVPRRGANVFEAAAIGAGEGMQLALNIGAMLIAFLAMIAMFNAMLGWLGPVDGHGDPIWTMERGLSYAFAPIAWLMGIEAGDCLPAGELLGIKIIANEFLAYEQLGAWIKEGDVLQPRSQMILTYALAGFSNFAAIGIQIGGIGGLAPERRSDLAKLGLKAMLGGAIACSMTACIAGLLS